MTMKAKVGDSLVIKPKKEDKWDKFFEALEDVDTSDFLKDREQLSIQERDLF